jgi:hypothetical protein
MLLRKLYRLLVYAMLMPLGAELLHSQSCTPQSQMTAAERDGLKQIVLTLATKVQAADMPGLRAMAVAPLTQSSGGADALAQIVEDTAPHLKQASFTVDSLWLFHAEDSAKNGANGASDAGKAGDSAGLVDFYCALPGEDDATFTLHVTDATKYAVAIIHGAGVAAPWQLSFVLQQTGAEWRLNDLIAKPMTAAGHDGLWYWTAGRTAAKNGQNRTAWLYLTRADQLLTPMNSIVSSNRDKLHGEIVALHLPEISLQQPLMVDGAGEKYSITALGTDDSFGGLDVVVHVAATDVRDAAAARKRNLAVMHALLTALPELRGNFHGVWVFADALGQSPYAIEQTMAQIDSEN